MAHQNRTFPGRKRKRDDELSKLFKEVRQVGAAKLTGADKRAFEAQRRKEIGIKPAKNPKVPLKILQGMRKKQQERREKKLNLDVESGMLTPTEARKLRQADGSSRKEFIHQRVGDQRGLEGIGDGTRGIRGHSIGKFSDGTLFLTKKEIESVESAGEKQQQQPQGKKGPWWLRKIKKTKKGKKRPKKRRRTA